MEFWGVEVKGGEPLKVKPGEDMLIHLSQASIGDVTKDKNESVSLYVNVDGKKMVLGTLFSDKLPQQLFDLVFDKDFELSHNWKAGSVYFYGYKAGNTDEEEDGGFSSDSDDSNEIPVVANNGQPEGKAKQEEPAAAAKKVKDGNDSAAGKQKVEIVEPKKDVNPNEDEDSDEDELDEDESSDEDMVDEDEDKSVSGGEESEEDDETPKKVASVKKRGLESATKTPVLDKKAKLATPHKTDGKKGSVHVATPYPFKQAGKTPAKKADQQTPKSGRSHTYGTGNKTFGSDNARKSHSKAKHYAGK